MRTDTGSLRVLTGQSTLRDLGLCSGISVDGTAPVAEVGREMVRLDVSALLVDGLGLVTERDVLRALTDGVDPDSPVAAITRWEPLVVDPCTTVVDAAATMLNQRLRHLVVDLAAARAVVSLRDVTAVLLQTANPQLWLTSLRVAVHSPSEIWLG